MGDQIPPEIGRIINILFVNDGGHRKNNLSEVQHKIKEIRERADSDFISGLALAAEGALTAVVEGRELSLPARILRGRRKTLLEAISRWRLPPARLEMEEGYISFWREVAKIAGIDHRGR